MSKVIQLDESNFDSEVLAHPGQILVSFSSKSAAGDAVVAPMLEQVAAKAGGFIKVGKVDIDASPALAERYKVTSPPKLVMFDAGKAGSADGVAQGS